MERSPAVGLSLSIKPARGTESDRAFESRGSELLWVRVSGAEWKPICWPFGISRPTANRPWEYGLSVHRLAAERPARADEAVAAGCGGGGAPS